jgi:hypothetical protein
MGKREVTLQITLISFQFGQLFGAILFVCCYGLGEFKLKSAHGLRAGAKENNMKKLSAKSAEKEMREEYDFSRGVRGKHFRRFRRGANVVVLEPGVAKVFSNAQTVNDSLRALAGIIRCQKAVVK